MKKCPPGIICIENFTMFFVVICLCLLFYIIYTHLLNPTKIEKNSNNKNIVIHESSSNPNVGILPSYPYSNIPSSDILLNPYVPPLRDERYFVQDMLPGPRIPINISTTAVDTTYRQVGILTPANNSKGKILPLMGRPLFTRRDLWQYYTMSDSNNSIKLPIIIKGKSATNEYGVDKIYGGSHVYVEGYNEAFKVTIYDNDVIKYIPFI
jgi:hypothetical protein